MRTPKIHNLSGNANESSPHEVIFLDTESYPTPGDEVELHAMRLWCAMIVRRHGRNPSRPRLERARGTSSAQLADWLDRVIKTEPTAWLYTHNLSFDLGVTRLPLMLIERGWLLKDNNLASDAPWGRMARGARSLRLCDSHSLFPYSLEHIGKHIGLPKLDLPDFAQDDDAWFARCERDVEIMAKAVTQAMDWWDEGKLGHWAATGPRGGWNAMRHMCVRRPGMPPIEYRGPREGEWVQHGDGHVVINPDPDARAFERQAIYQGRRETWRVGDLPAGTYAELDFRHAYLSVACDLKLPCRRGLAFESLPLDTPYLDHDNVGIIAEVTIRALTPRYPYRAGFGILYPEGTFTAVMAGPEIAEARRRGELVAIGRGYYYRLSYHMQPWALWLANLLDHGGPSVPPAALLMLKAHSRTVFGKWAAHTSAIIATGTTPVEGWLAEHAIDADTGRPCTILHMAGQWSMISRDLEADDAFPAVLAWVQSHVRLGLAAVLDQIPQRAVVSCSTDSVLVDMGYIPAAWDQTPAQASPHTAIPRAARNLCSILEPFIFPFELAPKGIYTKVKVLSPQHLRLDGQLRMAGVSGTAVETAPNEFEFYTWPSLGRQIELDEVRGYVRQRRKVDLSGMTVNRWTAVDGCTAPVRARVDADGTTQLERPTTAGCWRHNSPWRDRQWPALPPLDSEFWASV